LDNAGLTPEQWVGVATTVFDKVSPTRLIHNINKIIEVHSYHHSNKLNAVHFLNACMLLIFYYKKLTIKDLNLEETLEELD